MNFEFFYERLADKTDCEILTRKTTSFDKVKDNSYKVKLKDVEELSLKVAMEDQKNLITQLMNINHFLNNPNVFMTIEKKEDLEKKLRKDKCSKYRVKTLDVSDKLCLLCYEGFESIGTFGIAGSSVCDRDCEHCSDNTKFFNTLYTLSFDENLLRNIIVNSLAFENPDTPKITLEEAKNCEAFTVTSVREKELGQILNNSSLVLNKEFMDYLLNNEKEIHVFTKVEGRLLFIRKQENLNTFLKFNKDKYLHFKYDGELQYIED
jgi:hypothetical protein